jgi:hypothetical protein
VYAYKSHGGRGPQGKMRGQRTMAACMARTRCVGRRNTRVYRASNLENIDVLPAGSKPGQRARRARAHAARGVETAHEVQVRDVESVVIGFEEYFNTGTDDDDTNGNRQTKTSTASSGRINVKRSTGVGSRGARHMAHTNPYLSLQTSVRVLLRCECKIRGRAVMEGKADEIAHDVVSTRQCPGDVLQVRLHLN